MTIVLLSPTDTDRMRRARTRDPETSHQAAQSADMCASEAEVMRILHTHGCGTDEWIYNLSAPVHEWHSARIFYTPQRLRTARHALTLRGLVEWTGAYGISATGRKARVWRAVS